MTDREIKIWTLMWSIVLALCTTAEGYALYRVLFFEGR